MLDKLKTYLPAILWAILIFIASSLPGKDLPDVPIWQVDKIFHILFYGILYLLTSNGYNRQKNDKRNYPSRKEIYTFVVTIGYGFFIEIYQGLFLIDRHFDIFDVLANTIGAIIGLTVKFKIKNRK